MLLPPFVEIGWRAKVSPAEHPVSQYEFDVLIGADGKRNTLEGTNTYLFDSQPVLCQVIAIGNKSGPR